MLCPPAASAVIDMLLPFDLAEIKVLFGGSGFGQPLSERTGSKAVSPAEIHTFRGILHRRDESQSVAKSFRLNATSDGFVVFFFR